MQGHTWTAPIRTKRKGRTFNTTFETLKLGSDPMHSLKPEQTVLAWKCPGRDRWCGGREERGPVEGWSATSTRRPGRAVLLAAEAGGAEAVDVGEGPGLAVRRAGGGLVPDDDD